MRTILGLALVAVLLAVGDGRNRPLLVGDPSPLIEELIYETNKDLEKENKTVIDLPQLDSGFHFLYSLKTGNGILGKLNTIVLRGDRQIFKEIDNDVESVYHIDLTLGLQELNIVQDVSYRFLLLGSSGKLTLSVDGEAVRIISNITTVGSKKCSVIVQSVQVEDFGKIQVNLEPKGLFHPFNWVAEHTLQLVANHLGLLKNRVTKQLDEVVQKRVADPEVQAKICKRIGV